jgi:SAM-dependent methyltransferase
VIRRADREGGYVLGRTDAEHARLIQQAAVLRPSTERLFRAAGIGPGMRVLDVGCGAGDVSFLAAELVGPGGSVLGVDLDGAPLAVAEERRDALQLANASFAQGDFVAVAGSGEFDAVVGRLVLMYQPDPTESLRAIAAALRPGAIVAFQELASASVHWRFPRLPLMTSVLRWVRGAFAESGAHVDLGWELYWRMRAAGLEPDRWPLAEVPLDVGPDSLAHERWAAITRSLAPRIIELGLATKAEIDIETLAQRLRDEALAAEATIPLFSGVVVGQWARRP